MQPKTTTKTKAIKNARTENTDIVQEQGQNIKGHLPMGGSGVWLGSSVWTRDKGVWSVHPLPRGPVRSDSGLVFKLAANSSNIMSDTY